MMYETLSNLAIFYIGFDTYGSAAWIDANF